MLRSKKDLLAGMLHFTGILWPMRWLGPKTLIVIAYHRIRRDDQERGRGFSRFDDGVFGPQVSELRRTLGWLRSNSTLLSEGDLLDLLASQRPLPRRSVVVTFDDGYRDNYDLALPVLEELGIPAIFFIPCRQIDERQLGWWDLIAYLVKRAPSGPLCLRGVVHLLGADRSATIRALQETMKREPDARNRDLLEELSAACGVPLPAREEQDAELMTWEQVRDASRRRVAIGSHTVSHRVLATLDLDSQREELSRSKQLLEERTGGPVRTLAYPVGGYEHFHLETKQLALECGYQAAFSFNTGVNHAGRLDRFDLRRVCCRDDDAWLSAMMALPRLWLRRDGELAAPRPAATLVTDA